MRGRLKNGIISTLVIGTLLLANTAAFAAGEGVTYRGDTKKVEIQGTNNDLFGSMKGLMPGDVKTQVVQINNNSSETATFYLLAKDALLGEEAKEKSDALLQQLQLKVSITLPDSQEIILYQGTADGKDVNGKSMREPIALGSVKANGQATLQAQLVVPEGLGNDFQNGMGYIDWVFYCELADPGSGGGDPGGGYDPPVTPPTPKPDVPIEDEQVPESPIEEEIIDITDGQVPEGPAPGEYIVIDQDTLGNLPKTGGMFNYLDEIGLLLMVLCTGLVVINAVEKRKVK